MHQHERRQLGLRERVRLIAALVVLTGLAALSAVGVGVTLHDRSETLDSLDHWRIRLEDEAGASEKPRHRIGLDAPSARIRRLEEHLAAVPERLFVLGSVFCLASVLVVLGVRLLRLGRLAPQERQPGPPGPG